MQLENKYEILLEYVKQQYNLKFNTPKTLREKIYNELLSYSAEEILNKIKEIETNTQNDKILISLEDYNELIKNKMIKDDTKYKIIDYKFLDKKRMQSYYYLISDDTEEVKFGQHLDL